MENMKKNIHVEVSGKVQGVWFRANTKEKAEQLNINGWVKNTADGKVEAVFEGEEENIKEMLDWCHQGPPLAKVQTVDVEEKNSLEGLEGFSIKY
ncbi:MAG: acylphosphatase [Candidatus Thermoplasmatota archaeon]